MESSKKVSVIFLWIINIIGLSAGVVVQLTMLFDWNFISVFPLTNMGTDTMLYLNFLAVFVITALICVIVCVLVTGDNLSGIEAFKRCPGILLVLPGILFILSMYNSMGTENVLEKLIQIIIMAFYLAACAVSAGAVLYIKEDSAE